MIAIIRGIDFIINRIVLMNIMRMNECYSESFKAVMLVTLSK